MPNKITEAIFIGLAIWVVGLLMVLMVGQNPVFPSVAVPAAFLAAPLIYLLAKFHLRDVPAKERAYAAMRLGVLVMLVQFPLDAIGLFSMFTFNYPPLSSAAKESLVLALEVGYFWLLLVPWWVGKKR